LPEGTQTRGEALRAVREAKFDSWFRGRCWRVAEEWTTTRMVGGDEVAYDKGEFWVTPPGVFQTPLGHKGRHGFVIREIEPQSGIDKHPAVQAAFGFSTLKMANERYNCIRGLPDEPRKKAPERSTE
jgi:hypothetical protein